MTVAVGRCWEASVGVWWIVAWLAPELGAEGESVVSWQLEALTNSLPWRSFFFSPAAYEVENIMSLDMVNERWDGARNYKQDTEQTLCNQSRVPSLSLWQCEAYSHCQRDTRFCTLITNARTPLLLLCAGECRTLHAALGAVDALMRVWCSSAFLMRETHD